MIFGDAAISQSTELGESVMRLSETGRRTLVLARSDDPLSAEDVDAERLVPRLSTGRRADVPRAGAT